MTTTRRAVTLICAVLLAVSFVPAAHASPAPLRSGTIIGGYFPFAPLFAPGPGPGCDTNPDCLPWILSGCRAELAGLDPGLFSSIVDVSKLAASTKTRVFVMDHGPPGLVWGGASLEFWNSKCERVRQIGRYQAPIKRYREFRMPRSARWMTVATVDTTTIHWELR